MVCCSKHIDTQPILSSETGEYGHVPSPPVWEIQQSKAKTLFYADRMKAHTPHLLSCKGTAKGSTQKVTFMHIWFLPATLTANTHLLPLHPSSSLLFSFREPCASLSGHYDAAALVPAPRATEISSRKFKTHKVYIKNVSSTGLENLCSGVHRCLLHMPWPDSPVMRSNK